MRYVSDTKWRLLYGLFNCAIFVSPQALYGSKFRSFLSSITGIEFNDTVDLFGAVYGDTDKLLCHDDEFEGVCWPLHTLRILIQPK